MSCLSDGKKFWSSPPKFEPIFHWNLWKEDLVLKEKLFKTVLQDTLNLITLQLFPFQNYSLTCKALKIVCDFVSWTVWIFWIVLKNPFFKPNQKILQVIEKSFLIWKISRFQSGNLKWNFKTADIWSYLENAVGIFTSGIKRFKQVFRIFNSGDFSSHPRISRCSAWLSDMCRKFCEICFNILWIQYNLWRVLFIFIIPTATWMKSWISCLNSTQSCSQRSFLLSCYLCLSNILQRNHHALMETEKSLTMTDKAAAWQAALTRKRESATEGRCS